MNGADTDMLSSKKKYFSKWLCGSLVDDENHTIWGVEIATAVDDDVE